VIAIGRERGVNLYPDTSYANVKHYVEGHSGAVFRGFINLENAEDFKWWCENALEINDDEDLEIVDVACSVNEEKCNVGMVFHGHDGIVRFVFLPLFFFYKGKFSHKCI